MHKYQSLTSRYRTLPSSVLPISIPENVGTVESSEQVDDLLHPEKNFINDQEQIPTKHQHKLIEHEDISKSIHAIPQYQRYSTRSHSYLLDKRFSSLPIYINSILLILIRLMILFFVVLTVSLTVYYTIISISFQPKKTQWERINNWIFSE